MSKGWKIGLSVLAGMFLLLVLAGGGCLYVLSRYGREIGEGAKKSETEGESFGQNSDEAGCLKEALARNKKNNSITNIVSVNVFLGKCLQNSEPAQGFCENVPPRGDKNESKAWTSKRCAEAGQSGLTCEAMFQVVQNHCEGLDKQKDEKPKSN
jgi:hypothetical protein